MAPSSVGVGSGAMGVVNDTVAPSAGVVKGGVIVIHMISYTVTSVGVEPSPVISGIGNGNGTQPIKRSTRRNSHRYSFVRVGMNSLEQRKRLTPRPDSSTTRILGHLTSFNA